MPTLVESGAAADVAAVAEPVRLRVGPHPADGGLAVVNLRRPDRLAAQAIGHGHGGVVAGEHQLGEDAEPLLLGPLLPAAAVDVDDHGEPPIALIPGAKQV